MKISVRLAKQNDCADLLDLMKGLARFEGYIDDFKVSESDLLTRGFSVDTKPEFYALLAELDDNPVGMLVYYFIPFTFDLRPTLFIKELFVEPAARGHGAGEALFSAALDTAKRQACGRMKWDVLPKNQAARRFYERQGATPDIDWQGYKLELP